MSKITYVCAACLLIVRVECGPISGIEQGIGIQRGMLHGIEQNVTDMIKGSISDNDAETIMSLLAQSQQLLHEESPEKIQEIMDGYTQMGADDIPVQSMMIFLRFYCQLLREMNAEILPEVCYTVLDKDRPFVRQKIPEDFETSPDVADAMT